ncbi:MAG TPA: Ig-like domain-containing protein [Candidatus Saccharimonadales bacterium]|nr:Ig-like domain-containing protein [Candidatus Saccharimonadales bacterium]
MEPEIVLPEAESGTASRPKWLKPVLVAAVLITAVGLYFAYNALRFRVTATNPDISNVAEYTPFFKIEFNKSITSNGLVISAKPSIISSYSVRGNTLNIDLKYPMSDKTTYTITVGKVYDVRGSVISGKVFSFKPKNIPINRLPEDQRKALAVAPEPSEGEQGITFNNGASKIYQDPILSHLPYDNLYFNLSASFPLGPNNKPVLVLNAELILNESQMSDENASIAQEKLQVQQYIQSLGLNPNNYDIQYTVSTP